MKYILILVINRLDFFANKEKKEIPTIEIIMLELETVEQNYYNITLIGTIRNTFVYAGFKFYK